MRSFNGTHPHMLSDMGKIQSGITLAKKFWRQRCVLYPKLKQRPLAETTIPLPAPPLASRQGLEGLKTERQLSTPRCEPASGGEADTV